MDLESVKGLEPEQCKCERWVEPTDYNRFAYVCRCSERWGDRLLAGQTDWKR